MKRFQKILVDNGYDLGNYGPNKDGVDGSPGKLTRNAAFKWAKKTVKASGAVWFRDNLVELRMNDTYTDRFSDICLVISNDECVALIPWTTKPGKYWVNNPVTVGGITGTGCVVEGQTIDSHQFVKRGVAKWNWGGFFKQIAPLFVYRDGNKNNILDKTMKQVAPTWYGFFIHSMGLGNIIWNWSAGCRGCSTKLFKKHVRPYFANRQKISPVIIDMNSVMKKAA